MYIISIFFGIFLFIGGIVGFIFNWTYPGQTLYSAFLITAGVALFIYGLNKLKKCEEESKYINTSKIEKNLEPEEESAEYSHPLPPYKSRSVAVVLCLFFGLIGMHKFYIGRVGEGILYILITILLCWTVIAPLLVLALCIADLFRIIQWKERDIYNRPLI